MARRKTTRKINYKSPYSVDIWFERDRQSIVVSDANDITVAEWWDEDVTDMVEAGFFDGRNLAESVIRYLVDVKVIKLDRGNTLPDYTVV